jgi:hypothetical protein
VSSNAQAARPFGEGIAYLLIYNKDTFKKIISINYKKGRVIKMKENKPETLWAPWRMSYITED